MSERTPLQYAAKRVWEALLDAEGHLSDLRNVDGGEDALSERNRECVEFRVKCERLEGALKFYADPQTYSGWWEKQPDGRVCATVPTEEDNGGDRARAALAASQQPE